MTTNPNEPPDNRPDGQRPDLLARLSKLNPTVVVLAAVVLFLGVLLLPDVPAAVLVVLIAAALGWLLTRTWPVLSTSARTMRLLVIGLLLLIAAFRVIG